MSYLRFRQQVEHQLARSFSPEEETNLVDYNDAIFYGRRLQALEMGRLIGLAWRGLVNRLEALKRIYRNQQSINMLYKMDDRLLKDIGINRCEIMAMAKAGYLPHRRRPPIITPGPSKSEINEEQREAA